MSRREKSKFPALNKGLNTKSRKDFIEVDYIDGVKNSNGETVIRPMTDEEKKWLNQYYEETVVTNFLHHPELKRLNEERKKLIECKYVKQLQAQIENLRNQTPKQTELISELKEMVKLTKEQNGEKYATRIRKIEKKMQEARDQFLLYSDKEDHKQFYNENNKRNVCIYNNCKKYGTLLELTVDTYDKFIADSLDGLDCEMAIINEIEDTEE